MNNYTLLNLEDKKKLLEQKEKDLHESEREYFNSLDLEAITLSENSIVLAKHIQALNKDISNLRRIIYQEEKMNAMKKDDDEYKGDTEELTPEQVNKLQSLLNNHKEEAKERKIKEDNDPTIKLEDIQREVNRRINELNEQSKSETGEIISSNSNNLIEQLKKEREELLKQKKDSETNLLKDINVSFIGSDGLYEINYKKDNEKLKDLVTINPSYLEYNDNNELYKEVKIKYGEDVANSIPDYNYYKLLSNFDKKNNTNYLKEYIKGNNPIPLTYDLRGFKKLKSDFITSDMKSKIINTAKQQKKNGRAKIVKFSKIKAAAFLVGATVLGGLVANLSDKSSIKNSTQIQETTEQNIDKITEIPTTTEELTTESILKAIPVTETTTERLTETPTTEKISLVEDNTEVVKDEEKNLIQEDDELNLVYTNIGYMNAFDIIDENRPEEKNIKLGDTIKLPSDTRLCYDCYGEGPSVEINDLPEVTNEKASLVAVIQDGLFKEFYPIEGNENITYKELKEKLQKSLGGNIELIVNFSGYENPNLTNNLTNSLTLK